MGLCFFAGCTWLKPGGGRTAATGGEASWLPSAGWVSSVWVLSAELLAGSTLRAPLGTVSRQGCEVGCSWGLF